MVGATAGWGRDLPAELRPWSEDTEVSDVQSFDIGISPLADGSIEQGKCGYKTLQYMACARPVVVSPVGVHLDQVEAGVTGFFARTLDDWTAPVIGLRDNPDLRHAMGQAARDFVLKHYSTKVWAPILADHLAKAAGRTLRAAA